MAHLLAGAPLLVTTSNGAPPVDAPLVCLDRRTSSKKIFGTNGAPWAGCAISSFNTNSASEGGAPLVSFPSIALFLVVFYSTRKQTGIEILYLRHNFR